VGRKEKCALECNSSGVGITEAVIANVGVEEYIDLEVG